MGVNPGANKTEKIKVIARPPIKPSHVLPLLTRWITCCRPNDFPTMYCMTSLNCVRKIRYMSKPTAPPFGLTEAGRTIKNPRWPKLNTVINKPQVTDPTVCRNPCGSPTITMLMERIRIAKSGIKTINIWYC